MSNHFNELLLQRLTEIDLRLGRLEDRIDHVINEKSDKTDVKDVKTELKALEAELKADVNTLRDEVRSHG